MSLYKKTASIILSIIMLFLFCSCSNSTSEKIKTTNGKEKIVEPKYMGKDYHVTKKDNLELISKSGLVQLFFDKKNYSVSVLETSLQNTWGTLPTNEAKDSSAVEIIATKNSKTYKLNSQDNSVAFGTVKTKKIKNGIEVTYKLSDKAKKPNITIPMTVKYVLVDGSLHVTVNCSKYVNRRDFKINTISLLKYFGANNKPVDGDFLLVPDGCGAKINTNIPTKNKDYNYRIYNQDYSVDSKGKTNSIVPTFGMKSGNGAFGAIIRKGDALATVNAKKSKFNCVYPIFEITPSKVEKNKKYISKESYGGDLSVCYRFLSGTNANYSSIAAVCREQLIRDAVLSTKMVKETETCPINVNLIAVSKSGAFYKDIKTSYEEAMVITQLLKAKGINDLNILYRGALTKGLGQSNIKDSSLIGKLGSRTELKELLQYAATQEFKMFLDTNILLMKGGSSAKDLRNKNSKIEVVNPLNKFFSPNSYGRYLVTPQKLEKNVNNFLTDMREIPFSGYCISDAGSILYSDFDGKYTSREETKKIISDQIISMSTNKNTMTQNGNFYTLKNVDVVENIPLETSYKENKSYEKIPFVQMILHGMIEYSGSPINLEKNYNDYLLKSIEYGALLSYNITFDELDKKGKGDSISLCYEDWAGKMSREYEKYNKLFKDLRDSKMTDHYYPVPNLSCTLYDDGSYIYVNHSNKDISYNNLTIKAKNYLRVN